MTEENKEPNIVEEANKTAERLEKANEEIKEQIKRLEVIETRQILGGKTSAGQPQPQMKEETAKEYAARIMRGGI
jgi:hypothetical protein